MLIIDIYKCTFDPAAVPTNGAEARDNGIDVFKACRESTNVRRYEVNPRTEMEIELNGLFGSLGIEAK